MSNATAPQKDDVSKVLPEVAAPDANKKEEAEKAAPADGDKK